jgi:hypothetical protein
MTDHPSEGFGNLPHPSATFGTVPQNSEGFGTIPHTAERTAQHTLTVREVARHFEQAGVPRTERSIINWCQSNRQGIARLDAYFDTNERKYFITPHSVTAAIREEQAKSNGSGGALTSPPPKDVPNDSERSASRSDDTDAVKTLELKLRDLEITNRAKDYFIDQLKAEREGFQGERQNYVERLVSTSQEIGELRTQLFLLGSAPRTGTSTLPNDSETRFTRENSARSALHEVPFRATNDSENGVANSQHQTS